MIYEPRTDEEVDAELREAGYDPDEVARRGRQLQQLVSNDTNAIGVDFGIVYADLKQLYAVARAMAAFLVGKLVGVETVEDGSRNFYPETEEFPRLFVELKATLRALDYLEMDDEY